MLEQVKWQKSQHSQGGVSTTLTIHCHPSNGSITVESADGDFTETYDSPQRAGTDLAALCEQGLKQD